MNVQEQICRKSKGKPAFRSSACTLLHRQCACGQYTTAGSECEACRQKREGTLLRAAVNTAPANGVPPIVHEVLNSPGRALDNGTRAFMEPRFGHDFSRVRVHTDARAAESAQAVNALAYTVGRDVVFGEGQYAPETSEGRRLMAHELTHVVQQGNQDKTPGFLAIDSADNPLEREAISVANTPGRVGLRPIQEYSRIQRQSAATSPSPHSPWDDLPTNAQRATQETYFNALDAERQHAFLAVYNALTAQGLWNEVIKVFDVFPRNVRGIRAITKNGLVGQVFSHPHFCRDTRIGGSQHKGAATWRQVVQAGTEGLHISISAPNSMEAHLDTLAPVDGKESDGECRYSMPHVLPHIGRDLWGLRNIELLPPPESRSQPGDVQSLIRISIPGT